MANGNSLGICLPKEFTVNLSIVHGNYVKVSQEQERIVIEKVNE
jgi:antitoxin component of MazEF toxin-antitoxin module